MILITGGTGLVGAHLLFKLASSQKKVRAIYRNADKISHVKRVFSTYTSDYQALFDTIEWVKADLLDIPRLTEAFKDVVYVYHCAALVSFEPDKYHLLRKSNIEGTANIVNMSLSQNIKKLCYVSSIATLGKEAHKPTTEDSNWNADADNNVYAITKYGAEMEVWRGTKEGLNAVIVNPGVIIGAGIWRYGTGALFRKAKKGFSYYTAGSVGLVAVEDVVSIMVRLLESPITNERYVLVGETWTYKRFLHSLAQAVKAKPAEKLASKYLLGLAWRADWLAHKVTGRRRRLTKLVVQSLSNTSQYSSTKVIKALDYQFQSVEECIASVGSHLLKY